MFYIKRKEEIVETLPSCYDGMSQEELLFRGVLPFVDEGASKAECVKGGIVQVDGKFVQTYIAEKDFSKLKETRVVALGTIYEAKIDKLVRKSTQDLAFGEIKAIPKEVINQREVLKKEYHHKEGAIKAAKSTSELSVINL